MTPTLHVCRGTLYAVARSRLLEIAADMTVTDRGEIEGGRVTMRDNQTQLCIVAEPNAYVFDLDTKALTQIADNWRGSSSLEVIAGYGVYAEPGTDSFYVSAIQDFGTLDALQTADDERVTGNIVSLLHKSGQLMALKERSTSVWYVNDGSSDFPLSLETGVSIEVGCTAPGTVCKLGGTAFWLGQDTNGRAVVFAMAAYAPQRVSSHALEEKLSAIEDLSAAEAFVYHQEGLSYYCLRVTGLDTTWVYEVASGTWHERAEWVDGRFAPWRIVGHAFAYGKNIGVDADCVLYEIDPTASTNDGDFLIRDLITPHNAAQTLERRRIGSAQIDCDVGEGLPDGSEAKLMLRYSDDGGNTWGNWRHLTLGAIGEYKARARASMLGSARDRVWHIRCTDDVMVNVLSLVVDEK